MDFVTVTRTQNRYRRSVNGGWLGAAPEITTTINVRPEGLPHWTLGDSWLSVEWPDGVKESIFPFRSNPLGNYPPTVMGNRLAELFTAAGVEFHR